MLGRCNCGAVSFKLTGPLPGLYQCHCTLCRKQGGSSSNTATIVASNRFIWLTGLQGVGQWRKSSGFSSDFCQSCGSTVPNPLRDSDYMWIPMGLVEQEAGKIVVHIYTASKAPWTQLPDGIQKFKTMPDNLDAFVAILNQR